MREIAFAKKSALLVLIIYSCNAVIIKENKQENIIRGIKISQNFPQIDKTGKLISYDTSSTNIYYYRNQVLYVSSYHYNYTPQSLMIKADEIRYYFFVYTKEAKYGLLYDKHKFQLGKRVLIDSMIKLEWSTHFGFAPTDFIKTAENYNVDSGVLNRIYLTKGKVDTSLSGTCLLGFSNKLSWVGYSMIKELDTINKMKLYNIKIVNNPRYMKDFNITLDRIEQTFSLEEIQITNARELLKYFEKDRIENTLQKTK